MQSMFYLANPNIPREKVYRGDTNIVIQIKEGELTLFKPKHSKSDNFLDCWTFTLKLVRYLMLTQKSILINEIGNIIKWNKFKKAMYRYRDMVLQNLIKYTVV